MNKPSFVYVTYIATTPKKVWQALVDPEVAREYWVGGTGCARVNVSDWREGSRWEHQRVDETRAVDIVGKVVESRPPSRLILTWSRPAEEQDEAKHSRVTFDIELQADGVVRLTVTHEDLEKDEPMLSGISNGWPRVLSNLKTLLETGHAFARSAAA